MTEARRQVGPFGVWCGYRDATIERAVGVEQLGFGALWLGGLPSGDLTQIAELLAATSTLVIATGIINIWRSDAAEVAASFADLDQQYPGRFLLGVGTGHREAVQGYVKPYTALSEYVDVLLAQGVPPHSLVLAALGPKVLQLAGERTGGAHPYLVTPEHTRTAREVLGDGPLLAPEHKVVIETDPERARAIGRPKVQKPYLGLVNYTNNLLRLGWSEQDLADGGSDELIDALVARGTPDEIAGRLREHLAAGADHVCLQLLTADGADVMAGYRTLATALGI